MHCYFFASAVISRYSSQLVSSHGNGHGNDILPMNPTQNKCYQVVGNEKSLEKFKNVLSLFRRELEFNNNDRLHEKKHVVIPIRVHNAKNEPPLIVMEYCPGKKLTNTY